MAPSITFHADPEETAEAYVMERMAPAEEAAYRAHLEGCRSCVAVVEEQRIFVESMRAAMRQLAQKRERKAKDRLAKR
jgi:TPP-dependent indolepyruvate ferredoxin oxidoreductase alpha subunit